MTDYTPEHCDVATIDEVTLNASLEQWQTVGNAIGSGNPVNVAVAASAIVAGAVISVAKGVGGFVEGEEVLLWSFPVPRITMGLEEPATAVD